MPGFFIRTFMKFLLMRGATINSILYGASLYISTHTPHATSDTATPTLAGYRPNFNPHSLCREWQNQHRVYVVDAFQLTLPMRGATQTVSAPSAFQLILPMRGVTRIIQTDRQLFQLTLSMRGATKTMRYRLFSFCLIGISTHTPCAGSNNYLHDFSAMLSIHTPCAGSNVEIVQDGL